MDQVAERVPHELPRLFSMTLHLPEFATAWQHCDSVANFLGKAVSSDTQDSFRYGNLLSTVINEVLECLYNHHGPGEFVELEVSREGPWLGFSMSLLLDEETGSFYETVGRILAADDVRKRYEQLLVGQGDHPYPGQAGLMEIAASYDAKINVQRGSGTLTKIDVVLNMDRLLKE